MVRTVRGIIKIALWSVTGFFSALVAVGLVLSLRLLSGPVDTPIPQQLLDRVVAEAAPGWHVSAADAQIDFSSNDGLSGLKLREVVLSDPTGTEIVAVPVLGLRFKMVPSLNPTKMLTIREIALSGASVDVVRDADGAFQLALGEMVGGEGESDPFASLGDLGTLKDLPQLRIEDAQLSYTDLARGTTWRTEKARLTLAPTDTGLAATLGVVVDGGIGGAQLDAIHTAETGMVTATLVLDDVRPSRIAELDPLLAALARIDAPLRGKIIVSAHDGGTFERVSATLSATSGLVTLDKVPTALDSFSTAITCDVGAEICQIGSLAIATEDFRATTAGSIRQDTPGDMVAELTFSDMAGQSGETQITASTAALIARVNSETGHVTLERAGLNKLDLTGLPDGLSVQVAQLGGAVSYAPDTGSIDLPVMVAKGITVIDAQGTRQTLGQIKSALSLDTATETLTVSAFEALNLAATAEGLAVRVDQINGRGHADIAAQRIALSDTMLTGTTIHEASTGISKVASLKIGGTADLVAQTFTDGVVQMADAVVSVPDLYDAPMQISRAALRLAVAHNSGRTRLMIDEGAATIDGLPAKLRGSVVLSADGKAAGQIDASVASIDLAHLPRHWPKGVALGGLSWIRDNVKSGMADMMTVSAQFDEARPEIDTLDLRFGFRDGLVTFAPDMPPIERAAGEGVVTLDRLDLRLSGGRVQAPNAGALSIGGSSFAISDFAPDIPIGEVQLHAKGGVQSVLRLLDSKPLEAISPTGFDISRAKGEADVRVLLTLPLADDLRVDDVIFDARAKVHEYSLLEPQTNLPVSGDVLTVKATPKGMKLQSDARIGGLAARLGYAQGFERAKHGESNSILTLESFLSLADFARHGIHLDDHVEGLTAMKARIEMFDGGAARINADADLTNLVLKAEPLGWAKPAGVPATMRLSGFMGADGGGRIEALALRGEEIFADGSIGFGTDGQITRANFSRIQLGSAVDTGLIYGRKTNGRVGILIKGARLDLRHAFAEALEGDAAPPTAPAGQSREETDINLQVGRVFLRDDLGVFDLNGGIRLRGGALRAANINGKLNGSAPAKVLAERRPEGMAIRVTTPDAGAFIRATDIFTGAYDGQLVLDAVRRDTVSPAQISGRILVNDMVVHDAPTLSRILAGGAIASLMGDLANGGIKFSKIELPFSGVGPRWQIKNGVAYGPQIGLTLDGGYDVANSRLALNGSVSPAYAINGALGNVPLLGSLLTGGEGGGVFGVTFSVDGDTNKPVVAVNPLSALAPGFLRKIVAEVGKGKADDRLRSQGAEK